MRQLLILLIVLPLIACQATATRKTREPTPAELAAVKQEWIDKSCNAGEGWDEFEACLVVAARQLPPLDLSKREHFGERYDPKEWLACMRRAADRHRRGDGACEDYRLRRKESPEYWPNPAILPIKWPDAPKDTTSQSMSNKEYFEALCKTQAGEFIYKTVDNVAGVYQVRPFHRATDQEFGDRYVMEDPYSYTRDSTLVPWSTYVQPHLGKYDFFEVATSLVRKNGFVDETNPRIDFPNLVSPYVRFFRDSNAHPGRTSGETSIVDGKLVSTSYIVSAEPTNQIKARYGYVWRGIGGIALREKGIAGGEQAIVDLQTGEVLAVRRSFLFSDLRSRGLSVWWMGARHCSKELTLPTDDFVKRVLKPTHPMK